MKKAIVQDVGTIVVVEAPEPELREGEALIEMKACGLCHSDIAQYEGHLRDILPLPAVCGHEFGGIIREIRGTTDEFAVGDKVVVSPIVSCGECYYCKSGLDQLCEVPGEAGQYSNFGTHIREGALAEKVAVPFSNMVVLPGDFDMELTGIIEPAVVAYNNTKDIRDSVVVIVGAGAIGLLALKLLKLWNNTVIAVDIAEEALQTARRIGADHAINIRDEKRLEGIQAFLGGKRVDHVLLYYVDDDTLAFAVDVVKKLGEIRLIGLSSQDTAVIDPLALNLKSISLVGYNAYPMTDFREAVDLIVREDLNLGELISARYPLERTQDAFEHKKNGHVAKVIVTS